MDKANEALRDGPLCYLNLLTKGFRYFKILLKDEECVEVVDNMINKEKLEAWKFKCTPFLQQQHEDGYLEKSTFLSLQSPLLTKDHLILYLTL